MKKERHIFALYDEQLKSTVTTTSYKITDRDMIHRVSNVLRLEAGDTLMLFNRNYYAKATIITGGRGGLMLDLEPTHPATVWQPKISFLLPVLKKDALSQVIDWLVQAGVSAVQLVVTEKNQRAWGGSQELERLYRVAIAAAEQSKNFAFPVIHPPITLAEALAALPADSQRYYGDPAGQSLLSIVSDTSKKNQEIVLLVGPEGDLAEHEKKLVASFNFKPVALTSTILRAESAAFIMAATYRSFFSKKP